MSAHNASLGPSGLGGWCGPGAHEHGALAASIRRLQDSLSNRVPFAWRIRHGDNHAANAGKPKTSYTG
jgi:hypothetical protein